MFLDSLGTLPCHDIPLPDYLDPRDQEQVVAMVQTAHSVIQFSVQALEQKLMSHLVIALVIPIIELGLELGSIGGGFQVAGE